MKNNNCIFSLVLSFCITLVLLSAKVSAQEMPLPVEDQVPLFVKILNYDRSLVNKDMDKIVIGVLYQEKFRISSITKDEFIQSVYNNDENTINGKPIVCVPIEISNLANLDWFIDNKNISILYITPLRSVELRDIYHVTRRKKIMTLSGVSKYIRQGLSVGLELIDEKPKILLNIRSVRSEGIDFTSQLLRLAILIN